jgi:uncharacterized phage protein gp47/JayE
MRMTPSQRAYETKLDALCRELVLCLQALPADADSSAVVTLLTAVPHNTETRRRMLADAFQTLDEKPHWFGNGMHCQNWHAALRRTRNSPVHGPAMFALWCES